MLLEEAPGQNLVLVLECSNPDRFVVQNVSNGYIYKSCTGFIEISGSAGLQYKYNKSQIIRIFQRGTDILNSTATSSPPARMA